MNQAHNTHETPNINYKEPRFFLLLLTLLAAAIMLFYCIASMFTSVGYQTFAAAEKNTETSEPDADAFTIILDAGHGGEDPGAVVGSLKEKTLNLEITSKLATFLELSGYRVVLTRSDDRLLYNVGEENRKKYYDLYNRLQVAKCYPNGIFISIHMNKFPLESCNGLQTFYSAKLPENQLLAEKIQSASRLLMTDNDRTIKQDPNTIFLLKQMEIPAVLVECGFLSNATDAKNLSDQSYQDVLAFTLCCGITDFIEELQIENQLCLQ